MTLAIVVLLAATAVAVGTVLLLSMLPLLETLAAVTLRPSVVVSTHARPRVAILVPAHDEAGGLPATLASVLPQLAPGDRLLVVADNCTDDTAAVARTAGAEVVERFDAERRGKGYALAHGFDVLARDPPGVLVVFDADCIAEAGAVALLAGTARATGRPVQSLYLLRPAGDSVSARLSAFAFRLRNHVRPTGLRRAGLPCQLMGSGMAFPWSIVTGLDLASGHLAEDLQLGVLLGRRGVPPVFCEAARVDSRLPNAAAGAVSQRKRWVHGHLAVALGELPALLLAALRRRDLRLVAMAWDLAVPPFVLLTASVLGLCVVGAAIVAAGGPGWPLAGAVTALAFVALTVVIAQRAFARDLIRLREIFVVAPLYLAARLPTYLRFFVQRQVEWVRTRRDAG